MNKRYSKIILAAVIAPILFSSCASIFTKSTYPVSINTTPADATVTITDKKGNEVFVGQTPTVVKLKSSAGFFSKAEYQIKLSLNGYEEKVMTITSSIEGWYFANILLGGIIGMLIVDPATGAMWSLDTENISTTLKPKSNNSDTASLEILNINDIPESLRDQLVRIN